MYLTLLQPWSESQPLLIPSSPFSLLDRDHHPPCWGRRKKHLLRSKDGKSKASSGSGEGADMLGESPPPIVSVLLRPVPSPARIPPVVSLISHSLRVRSAPSSSTTLLPSWTVYIPSAAPVLRTGSTGKQPQRRMRPYHQRPGSRSSHARHAGHRCETRGTMPLLCRCWTWYWQPIRRR